MREEALCVRQIVKKYLRALIVAFQWLFQKALTQGRRSSALSPLGWAFAASLAGLVWSLGESPPMWVPVFLAWVSGGLAALYAIAFVYLLIKDPDSLRSETYSLEKMAIQHGLYGDSQTGLIRGDRIEPEALGPGRGAEPLR